MSNTENTFEFLSLAASLDENWQAAQGHDVIRAVYRFGGHNIPYGLPNYPHAFFASAHNTYAPWLKDQRLAKYFELINPPQYRTQTPSLHKFGHTLVDIYRCWTIWQIVTQMGSLPGDVIEVGAYQGGTSALIGHALATTNQRARLFICDTFTGVVKAGVNDTAYKGGEHSDTTEELVRGLVSRFVPEDQITIARGIFPEDTHGLVEGCSFKFAHIDVDVYQSAVDSVVFLWPKLVPGGIILFDDYGLQGTEGMTRAAEELAASVSDMMLIYNFNGQAMLLKTPTF